MRLFLAALLLLSGFAHGVTFTWDQITDPAVVGVHLWCGPAAGGPYTLLSNTPAPGNTHVEPDANVSGKFCVATAYDASAFESAYSNEVACCPAGLQSVSNVAISFQLFVPPPAPLIAHVHAAANGVTTGTTVSIPAFAVQSGDVVILSARGANLNALTISDGLGTTYAEIDSTAACVGWNLQMRVYLGVIVASGTITPTIVQGGAASRLGIAVQVARGVKVQGELHAKASGTGTLADSGVVTTIGNAYFAAFVCGVDISAAGSGYGNLMFSGSDNGRIGTESKLVIGGVTENGDFTFSISQGWTAFVVALPSL